MTLKNKTTLLTKEEALKQCKWFVFDASGKTLGRFASEIAKVLRGKHKTNYTPHVDCGDGVIVINAEKIVVTGKKESRKIYRHYTGYMGGLRETPYNVMKSRKPTFIIEHAVKAMLPKSRLASHQYRKLRVFAGDKHRMQAQKPIEANI